MARVNAYSGEAWYEGFVFRYRRMMGAEGPRECIQVFYDETEEEEWFELPEPSLVFNASLPGTARVAAARVTAACRMYRAV